MHCLLSFQNALLVNILTSAKLVLQGEFLLFRKKLLISDSLHYIKFQVLLRIQPIPTARQIYSSIFTTNWIFLFLIETLLIWLNYNTITQKLRWYYRKQFILKLLFQKFIVNLLLAFLKCGQRIRSFPIGSTRSRSTIWGRILPRQERWSTRGRVKLDLYSSFDTMILLALDVPVTFTFAKTKKQQSNSNLGLIFFNGTDSGYRARKLNCSIKEQGIAKSSKKCRNV